MAEAALRRGRLRAVGIAALPAWDGVLIGLGVTLGLLGLVAVYTASISLGARMGQPMFYLQHQAVYLVLGGACGFLVTQLRLDAWRTLAPTLLVLGGLLLVAVLVPGLGREVNGARRWLGLPGFALQPSELAKLALVLFTAARLAAADTPGRFRRALSEILLALGVYGALLLLEPDYGALAVMAASTGVLLFLGGVRLLHFLVLAGLGVAALGALAVAAPYRLARLIAFLDPWADPFGSGFQLTQALIAFGRGGWLGAGLGNSVQKLFYLPEAHTDFVVAVLAEELGLGAVLAVLGIYTLLSWRVFGAAREAALAGARFASGVGYGVGTLFGLQAFLNLGVCMGVLPTKGLTLPLLSYGGSSLLASCVALGLMIRVDHENRTRSGVVPL